jgi:acyl-CoA reductase-like NAD-dependent aldehyde dehydrogenase
MTERANSMSDSTTVNVAGVPVSTAHFIDRKRVASARTFEDRSPIDRAHLADVSSGSAEEIDAAVAAARRAFPAWAAPGPEGRLPILQRFAAGIRARAEDNSLVETADNGSLLATNRAGRVERPAHDIAFFADWALKLSILKDSFTLANA